MKYLQCEYFCSDFRCVYCHVKRELMSHDMEHWKCRHNNFPQSYVTDKGYFKHFASLILSPQKINKWTSNPKNFILQITSYFSPLQPYLGRHLPINEFVDACGIRYRVLLFSSLPLRDLSLVFICPILNVCTHRFSWFFFNILHTIHHAHSRVNFTNQNIF